MAPTRTAWSFPILKDADIIQNVNDMSIPLTETELRQPNYQVGKFVRSVAYKINNNNRLTYIEDLWRLRDRDEY